MDTIKLIPLILLFFATNLEAQEDRKNARLPKWPNPDTVVKLPEIGNAPQVEVSTELWLPSTSVQKAAAMIDKQIMAGLAHENLKPNPASSDTVFVRRIYLDAAGRIPTAEETRVFLDDSSRDKRAQLIDELLVSDGYRSHQFNWLADMLRHQTSMGLRRYANYERWLKDQIALNRKWNEVVSDLLTAEGTLASNGPTGYLLRDPAMPLDNLANTLTIFLGANVSCAQCHDHPFAEWSQKDFYQMAAFFGGTYVSDRDPRKIANQLENELHSKRQVGTAVAQNMYAVFPEIEQKLTYPEDYFYNNANPGSKVDPSFISWEAEGNQRPPDFDTSNVEGLRDSFATWLTHSENPRFAVAVANRLWKRAFGIAVQEPIEDLDNLERASNPALLRELGNIMVLLKFDLREFQRIMFNTQAYQAEANITPPIGEIDEYLFAGPVLRRMTSEQTWDSILALSVGTEVDAIKTDYSHRVTRFDFPYDLMTMDAIEGVLGKMADADYWGSGKSRRNQQFPEADLASGPMPSFSSGKGFLIRASELPQPAEPFHFLRMFGQSPRLLPDDGSREGSIPQALMLMNGPVHDLLAGRNSVLMSAVDQHEKRGAKIEELYFSFFGRAPSEVEADRIDQVMDEGMSLSDLVWTLYNMPEFIFVQ
ncbi:MAG: DUF1549 domain-containing protein [Verrucomicrobiota bacterium]